MSSSTGIDSGELAYQSGRYNPEDDLRPSFEQFRTSEDIRREDQHIIDDDEEVEGLLMGGPLQGPGGMFGRRQDEEGKRMDLSIQRGKHVRHSKKRSRAQDPAEDERGGLLFEMEEGANRSSSESLGDSGEIDRQKLQDVRHSVQVGGR